jgi:paraquat-inducible protein A
MDVSACPDCDLLQRIPTLPPGEAACCPRCGRKLATCKPGSLNRTTALAASAAIAFLLANLEPLMGLSAAGREASTTIAGGAWQMWLQGEKVAALLIALIAVIVPALEIGLLLTILVCVRRPPAPNWVAALLRWAEIATAWSMVEVMMLGILVSLVKIAALARVVPGIGIFAAGGLILLLAAMSSSYDPREAWSRICWANGEWPHPPLLSGETDAAGAER